MRRPASSSLIPVLLALHPCLHCLPHDGQNPGTSSAPGKIRCATISAPIAVSANNSIYAGPRVDSNIDAVNFAWDTDTWSHPNSTARIQKQLVVQKTFDISIQLCTPAKGAGKENMLQIATHGVGYDKRYWDPQAHGGQNSYTHAAVSAGYSILTYDRLGVGESSKPDAYTVVQAPVQLEILREITLMARSGKLSQLFAGPPTKLPRLPQSYAKVVHVGHSYGTILTAGLVAAYPELTDGAIGTGFIVNDRPAYGLRGFGWEYAPENDAERFGDRGSGYIVQGTKGAVQQTFVSKAALDRELLDDSFAIRQPAAVAEFWSSSAILARPATRFKGPLLFFLAENDFAICSGDCKGAYSLPALKQLLYPNAAVVEDYIQPRTGHGLTFHRNATAGYGVMFDWLDRHGL